MSLFWKRRNDRISIVISPDLSSPPRPRPLGRMPVAIPDDIENRSLPKASGVVRLPSHVAWSPPYEYDLNEPRNLRCAYERVMTEGLDEDVRYYIDLDTLVEIWNDLYLSPHVREAWTTWLSQRGLID